MYLTEGMLGKSCGRRGQFELVHILLWECTVIIFILIKAEAILFDMLSAHNVRTANSLHETARPGELRWKLSSPIDFTH